MPIFEFDIINQYFSRYSLSREDVILGVGDDAALLRPPLGQELAVAIDTLVEGVHFPAGTSAEAIAYKALAVNLSDMAAMGAEPAWFTLALTLPEVSTTWLEGFSCGLFDLAQQYRIVLVGGDTTRGPLTISIQVTGYVPAGQGLLRCGAKAGDQVFVSGTLGDAALGLLILQDRLQATDSGAEKLIERLNRPQPRVELGLALRGLASACIDISDGLLADLRHILEASGRGARIYADRVPVSDEAKSVLDNVPAMRQSVLTGGDDYELCFCVPPTKSEQVTALAKELNYPLTCIGEITEGSELQCLDAEGRIMALEQEGFDHFSG